MKLRTSKRLLGAAILFYLLLLPGLHGDILLAMPLAQRIVLPNHLVVLVVEDQSRPFVTFRLLVDAGSREDPPGEAGLANLTMRGLLLGTTSRSEISLNEALSSLGTTLETSCTKDYATISLKVLKRDLNQGFGLLLETVTEPAFPYTALSREKDKLLGFMQATQERPAQVAERAFREALYDGSPYAHPVVGTRESLPSITRNQVVQFYRTYYHPNNSILIIVGDVTVAGVKTRLLPQLEQWPQQSVPVVPFKSEFAKGPQVIKINRPTPQADIILGQPGIKRGDTYYNAIAVLNYILGSGGFNSRLAREICVQRRLAYSIVSLFIPFQYPGSFQVVMQTRNAFARQAIALAIQQIERLRQYPVSEEELARAKKYLISSFPLRLDSQEKLAAFYSEVQYYHLGLDYAQRYPALINAVTRRELLRVARAYLHPRTMILSVVGNQKEIGLGSKLPTQVH